MIAYFRWPAILTTTLHALWACVVIPVQELASRTIRGFIQGCIRFHYLYSSYSPPERGRRRRAHKTPFLPVQRRKIRLSSSLRVTEKSTSPVCSPPEWLQRIGIPRKHLEVWWKVFRFWFPPPPSLPLLPPDINLVRQRIKSFDGCWARRVAVQRQP